MNIQNRSLKIFITVVLTVSVLFSMVSGKTYGKIEETGSSINNESYYESAFLNYDNAEEIALEISNKRGKGICEIESLRDEYTKHIMLEDGSFQAIAYMTAVHRQNENGTWIDIDNRLSLRDNKYETEDGFASFGQTADSFIYSIEKGKHKIEFDLTDGNNLSFAEIDNHKGQIVVNDDMSAEEKINALTIRDTTTRITYKDVYDNIDIEYILSANDVKENIIIKEHTDKNVFDYYFRTGELTPVEEEDGTIGLYNGDILVFTIDAPYMYDAEGNVSNNVSYTIEGENGVYNLSVYADSEWLDNAVYPVIIDPTVNSGNNGYDTYVSSVNSNTNYGTNSILRIQDDANDTCYSFLKINMPSIPAKATVTYADLVVSYFSVYTTYKYMNIDFNVVNNLWNANSLTWSTQSGLTIDTVLAENGTITCSSFMQYTNMSIYMTGIVREWYAGRANYGIRMKYNSGTCKSIPFDSKDCVTTSYRPFYRITYTVDNSVLTTDMYYIENAGTFNYSKYEADNDLKVRDFADSSSERWQIIYLHNGYYSITSSYSGKALSVASGNENVNNASLCTELNRAYYRQQWKIISTSEGRFKIKPRSGESYTTEYCMAIPSTGNANGRSIIQKEYISSGSDYCDEWYLLEGVHPYGTKTFRTLTQTECENINCFGYAMFLDDLTTHPNSWSTFNAYALSIQKTSGATEYSDVVKTELALSAKADFETWLNNYTGISDYTLETDFYCNGTRGLDSNQYRVVLRTGIHNIYINGTYCKIWDYHFWYQTSDGTWADKHGIGNDINIYGPEHLQANVFPKSTNTSGWGLSYYDSQWQTYDNFYDNQLYVYIITVSNN